MSLGADNGSVRGHDLKTALLEAAVSSSLRRDLSSALSQVRQQGANDVLFFWGLVISAPCLAKLPAQASPSVAEFVPCISCFKTAHHL